ncbi:MAG: glutamine-hydrolyzing carbamoyl-phosphate synthase small subunit [Sphaerochaetaceae bacterium]|nr:glutamine-hydrolyzing carbamoyl-phosphate synthase small subunit [Sphaerochaetaceae bacterium]
MTYRYLILRDGTVFKGKPFGHPEAGTGEIVFNTACNSYPQVLTDNSYAGQIVVMTSSHIGTYGCRLDFFQHLSQKPLIEGMVVKKLYTGAVPTGAVSLDELMKTWQIPGVKDVDTRQLTVHIREHGAMYAAMVDTEEEPDAALVKETVERLQFLPPMEERDFISLVSQSGSHFSEHSKSTRVLVIDYGAKRAIIDSIRHLEVTIHSLSADEFLSATEHDILSYDVLFLSNGPGDPRFLVNHVEKIRSLITKMAVRGICLGHQLIALALGAHVDKMTYGHHGSNHPVLNTERNTVCITSQNHTYTVLESSVPHDCRVWFKNLNDGTVEGLISSSQNVMCTQFHPESAPGTHDALYVFADFLS